MPDLMDSMERFEGPLGTSLYVPDPVKLETDRESYIRLWRVALSEIVEIPDAIARREQVTEVYRIAQEDFGFSVEEMNDAYETALDRMDRPESIGDQIVWATAPSTGERIQVWPPDIEGLKTLKDSSGGVSAPIVWIVA